MSENTTELPAALYVCVNVYGDGLYVRMSALYVCVYGCMCE